MTGATASVALASTVIVVVALAFLAAFLTSGPLVEAGPHQLASISTEVKKAAKKLPGSSVVINRRISEEMC